MKLLLSLMLLGISPVLLVAGDECRDCRCDRCGCDCHCHKICRVICTWKDVKETEYSCRCEDVAIPGHSEKCCTEYECPCECGPHYCPIIEGKKPLYSIWSPSECARIRTVKKLYKHEVTRKVPTYEWVVEYCCDHCCNATSCEPPAPDSQPSPPIPPPAITSNDKQADRNVSEPTDQLAVVTLRRIENRK